MIIIRTVAKIKANTNIKLRKLQTPEELISLLRGRVDMQSIEVSEKTLPQISTVFQGLRGIV